jgi:hypothetical protein
VACSPRHRRYCSPAHSDWVDAYRTTRDLVLAEVEELTALLDGDLADWRARGGRIPTLHDFMLRR